MISQNKGYLQQCSTSLQTVDRIDTIIDTNFQLVFTVKNIFFQLEIQEMVITCRHLD